MTRPRFVVWVDNGDLDVEVEDGPTSVEGYDIAEARWYSVDGERLHPETDNGKEWGSVLLRPTGDTVLDELEEAVRSFILRSKVPVVDTGDFLVDAANAIAAAEWSHRWPKRPAWLDRLLHGIGPTAFDRC